MTASAPADLPKELPDRVSLDADNPHYFKYWKKIGVKINGRVVFTCLEFCVSEGWVLLGIKDHRGYFKRERGRIVAARVNGVVEPYWR